MLLQIVVQHLTLPPLGRDCEEIAQCPARREIEHQRRIAKLRVKIHQQNRIAGRDGERGGKVDGQGRLPNTTFCAGDRNQVPASNRLRRKIRGRTPQMVN